MHKKCRNTEFFLVRIFLYSVQIEENADQKKVCVWTLFTQCQVFCKKVALRTFAKFTCKDLYQGLFSLKLHGCSLQLYQKETPVKLQIFCRFFQKGFIVEYLQGPAYEK